MLKINGVQLPAPIKINSSYMDITNAKRNSAGTMIIDIIAEKVKLEVEWGLLSVEEVSYILNTISPSTFQIQYFDIKQNKEVTKMFYKGNRSMQYMYYKNGVPYKIKGFKVNFIEV